MFDISIEIDRPAQTVFRHIEDIEAAPAWYSAVQSVAKLTAGPVGRVLENIVEVTEFEVDALLTLSSLSGPTPFTYRFRLGRQATERISTSRVRLPEKGFPGRWRFSRRSRPASSNAACE
ncbi:SRPBCC family protein [Mesorhizobium sp. M0923]|uniref:SRPBCC family protein n=1 Tax=unclassified Mesorhizobium TaxID=325217 RepID=UPI00333861E6